MFSSFNSLHKSLEFLNGNGMGMGMSGWEWEGMGKFKKKCHGTGKGMGMTTWEWEGMGTKILFLHTSRMNWTLFFVHQQPTLDLLLTPACLCMSTLRNLSHLACFSYDSYTWLKSHWTIVHWLVWFTLLFTRVWTIATVCSTEFLTEKW